VKANEGNLSPLNPTTTAQRYWSLNATNIKANLSFSYLPGDVMGNEANYKVIKVESGVAIPFPSSIVSPANHVAAVSRISSFSNWTVGQPSAPTAAPATISGLVTDVNGAPPGGVLITLSGSADIPACVSRPNPQAGMPALPGICRTIMDASGQYHFDNIETDGFYTVTPERANYLFSPAVRSFSLVANKTDAVFAASPTAETANPLDTAEFFVRQQYLDFLNREPDQVGLDYWSAQLRQCREDIPCFNDGRRNVSAAFFIEQEFQQTGSFIYRMYEASLGR
jgi:hypothetical protein